MRGRLNILDTLLWLGDMDKLTIAYSDVDYLVITLLEYQKLENIPSSLLPSTLPPLLDWACPKEAEEAKLFEVNQIKLWEKVTKARRYSSLTLLDAVATTRGEGAEAEQFAAALFQDGEETYLVFRGTDESLTGWKEDFNLAFEDEIPAERRALEYLEAIAPKTRRIHILGHSKGGTLALYSALKAEEETFDRIEDIVIFDAPGLPDSLTSVERWSRVKDKTRSYIPTFSIVGMLFNTVGKATVVKSSKLGLLQHDAFTWLLSGGKFLKEEGVSERSLKVDHTLKAFLSKASVKDKEILVETIYKILKATDEENVWLMPEVAAKRFPEIKKAISSLSEEEKNTLMSLFLTLDQAIGNRRKGIDHGKKEKE